MTPNEPGDSAMTEAFEAAWKRMGWPDGPNTKDQCFAFWKAGCQFAHAPDSRASIAQSSQASAGGVPLSLRDIEQLAREVEIECLAGSGVSFYMVAEMAIETTIDLINGRSIAIAEICRDADGFMHIEPIVEDLDDLKAGMKLYTPAASIAPLPVVTAGGEQIARMLEGYAESYEMMARMKPDNRVRCYDVAYDIRHNMVKWVRANAQAAPTAGGDLIGYLHPDAYTRLTNGESAGCRQKSYGVRGEVAIYAARIGDDKTQAAPTASGEAVGTLEIGSDGAFDFVPHRAESRKRKPSEGSILMKVYAARIGDEADARDSERLDWLDATNSNFQMGGRVGIAPAGSVSIQRIIELGEHKTSIRAAIDAAIRAQQPEQGEGK